jgi:NitT/TauT family transport system substrate-binding protein
VSWTALIKAFTPAVRGGARALAAAIAATSLTSGTAEAGDSIRVGFVGTSLASIPIVVADGKGFFAEQGLDAELLPFESSSAIALAVGSGDADFGTTGLSEPFFVLANQGSIRIIGGDTVEHPGFHAIGFVASNQAYAAGLKTLADFGGHSVGITQVGSPLQYSLALVVEKYGVDLSTVRVLGLQSNSNVASALTGGQIDASIMSSANLLAVVNRGSGKFLGWLDEEVRGAQLAGTVASTKLANDRPETVRRFLAAFRKAALTWDAAFVDAKGDRADQPSAPEMIALMSKGLNQPPEVIIQGLNYVDPEARVSPDDIQRMVDWYEAQGMQKGHIDAKSLIDMRYARIAANP